MHRTHTVAYRPAVLLAVSISKSPYEMLVALFVFAFILTLVQVGLLVAHLLGRVPARLYAMVCIGVVSN